MRGLSSLPSRSLLSDRSTFPFPRLLLFLFLSALSPCHLHRSPMSVPFPCSNGLGALLDPLHHGSCVLKPLHIGGCVPKQPLQWLRSWINFCTSPLAKNEFLLTRCLQRVTTRIRAASAVRTFTNAPLYQDRKKQTKRHRNRLHVLDTSEGQSVNRCCSSKRIHFLVKRY